MTGKTVLLVEDEAIIAMDLELTLESHGFTVMGPFNTVAKAQAALSDARPEAAILDLNLGHGETSIPVAETLNDLGVPIIFLTGYSQDVVQLPDALDSAGRLSKPLRDQELVDLLNQHLS